MGVTTVRATQSDLPELLTATGTVAPLSSVEVRPQETDTLGMVGNLLVEALPGRPGQGLLVPRDSR